ncbi:MAG: peptidoglycan-binding protein [Clostridia bacterium]|nr:peptidoglycan-binding protein [Clostridia bacterium]
MSKQTIFKQLREAGCSASGALGLMGNWQEESGNESCRLQGDFTTDRFMSRDYANKVNSGMITEDTFAKDSKGWGLAQWTYWTRKQALLNFCRRRGVSIADEAAQVDFAVSELKTDYAALWQFLCSCTDDQLYSATDRVCREYERPAFNNVAVRFSSAKALRDELQSKAVEEVDNGVERFWPPRMICKGMNGPDVAVLQALLKARGYTLSGTAGVFGDSTDAALRKYQRDNGLDDDGIAGPKTWAEILKY